MNNLFNKIYLSIVILMPTNCFCQGIGNSDITDITKVTFFNPGISYEKKIANFQSLYAQLFMNTSFSIGYSDAFGFTSSLHFDPAATLQYRYYYNANRRGERRKNTKMNNLNYVSFITEIVSITEWLPFSDHFEKKHRALNNFGLIWGLQRNYHNRFSLDLNVGPGYFFMKETKQNGMNDFSTENKSDFTILGQINLGFWLNKRDRN
jgi:hypothetical protein